MDNHTASRGLVLFVPFHPSYPLGVDVSWVRLCTLVSRRFIVTTGCCLVLCFSGAPACFSGGGVSNPTPHPGHRAEGGAFAAEAGHAADDGDDQALPASESASLSDAVVSGALDATESADTAAVDHGPDSAGEVPWTSDVTRD